MKFGDFLKRDTGNKVVAAPQATLSRLEKELQAGARLTSLLERRGELLDGLPLEHLREIVESFRRFKDWRSEAKRVGRRLESIEREVIGRTTRVHQLEVIERTCRLTDQGRVEALDRPRVLATALELWDSCRSEVRRRGRARVVLTRPDHPLVDQYGDYIDRTEDIDKLKAYRWLAMRRGEREGVLTIELTVEGLPLAEQVAIRRDRLGNLARDRTDESIYEELVDNDLRQAIWDDLDEWARDEAFRFACDAYAGLLQSRPLKVDRLGAVFLGAPHKPVGAAVVDNDGETLDSIEVETSSPGWMGEVLRFLEGAKVQHIVVPSDTRSSKRLAELQKALGPSIEIISVRPVAMAEGRKGLSGRDLELPKASASAVILARRAQNPMKAWGQLDPIRVGVGEYQADLDEEDLREALLATKALVKSQGKKAAAAPMAPRLNPSPLGAAVRTAAELRPGMYVSGQITNITGFGAFISLGLEYEGMVHVSELSDEFVSNPNEVVKIGDKVTARVLAVDPKRRRISLSLRTQPAADRRAPRRTASGPQRSQALRDLEKLFSK